MDKTPPEKVKCCTIFQDKLSQLVGGAGIPWENHLIGGFLPIFFPVSCSFTDYLNMIFLREKIGPIKLIWP